MNKLTWTECDRMCRKIDQFGKMRWWWLWCVGCWPSTFGFRGDSSEKARPNNFFVGAAADAPEEGNGPRASCFDDGTGAEAIANTRYHVLGSLSRLCIFGTTGTGSGKTARSLLIHQILTICGTHSTNNLIVGHCC